MKTRMLKGCRAERGVGLMEVMISIVIGMLLMIVIYQVYEISEGQKRTITAGSDAQQGATYGLYVLGRDLSMAGNGVASAAASLDTCAMLRPIPVLIDAGATAADPDTITVLYGGSSSLSTSVPFVVGAIGAQAYVVRGPVGFSADPIDIDKTDRIVAVEGANCTLSRINPGGIAVDPGTGFTTIAHTPIVGAMGASYNAGSATLVNLGQPAAMGRIAYTVDTTGRVLRTQNQLPTNGPVNPLINDVVNLKAQYGVECNGVLTWEPAVGPWSSANVPTLPLNTPPTPPGCTPGVPSLQQIRAIRVAIVTRSAQYERDAVTPGPLLMLEDTVSMTLSADDQHYRYKILETIVPLRNALWNMP